MKTENSLWHHFAAWIGVDTTSYSHPERLISAFGGFLGIACVYLVSMRALGDAPATPVIVASMGASAVLLFAAPHGPLSQPWSLVGGHFLSAIIGVSVAEWISWPPIAAATAVGVAIGVMHYARCLHPPGGATALSAVIGGTSVHDLGYGYVLNPVLLNVAIILAMAILFNSMFSWRRYPSLLAAGTSDVGPDSNEPTHSDYQFALRAINSTIDVTEDDLARIYHLAASHAAIDHPREADLHAGHAYSNGRYGRDWQVRRIDSVSDDGTVEYEIAAGADEGQKSSCHRDAFSLWARYEVKSHNRSWRRVD